MNNGKRNTTPAKKQMPNKYFTSKQPSQQLQPDQNNQLTHSSTTNCHHIICNISPLWEMTTTPNLHLGYKENISESNSQQRIVLLLWLYHTIKHCKNSFYLQSSFIVEQMRPPIWEHQKYKHAHCLFVCIYINPHPSINYLVSLSSTS